MSISRIRQDEEEEEELRNSLPYGWLKGIAPLAPSRHRHGEHFCYCPECDYEVSVEEGQKCNLIECPKCGARMRAT